MEAVDSNGKPQKAHEDFVLEFDGLGSQAADGRHIRLRDDRAAQVAFETNSSLGSENCSLDSI